MLEGEQKLTQTIRFSNALARICEIVLGLIRVLYDMTVKNVELSGD